MQEWKGGEIKGLSHLPISIQLSVTSLFSICLRSPLHLSNLYFLFSPLIHVCITLSHSIFLYLKNLLIINPSVHPALLHSSILPPLFHVSIHVFSPCIPPFFTPSSIHLSNPIFASINPSIFQPSLKSSVIKYRHRCIALLLILLCHFHSLSTLNAILLFRTIHVSSHIPSSVHSCIFNLVMHAVFHHSLQHSLINHSISSCMHSTFSELSPSVLLSFHHSLTVLSSLSGCLAFHFTYYSTSLLAFIHPHLSSFHLHTFLFCLLSVVVTVHC